MDETTAAQNGCPTFRARDMQHKADFMDMLTFFGRINAFRAKVASLHAEGEMLSRNFDGLVSHLSYLHTSLPKADRRLQLVEQEHLKSETMLKRRSDCDAELERAQTALAHMLRELDPKTYSKLKSEHGFTLGKVPPKSAVDTEMEAQLEDYTRQFEEIAKTQEQ